MGHKLRAALVMTLAALTAALLASAPVAAEEIHDEQALPSGVKLEEPLYRWAEHVTASDVELPILIAAEKRCRKEFPEWKRRWLNFARPEAATQEVVSVLCWSKQNEAITYLADADGRPESDAWVRYRFVILIDVNTKTYKVTGVRFQLH